MAQMTAAQFKAALSALHPDDKVVGYTVSQGRVAVYLERPQNLTDRVVHRLADVQAPKKETKP